MVYHGLSRARLSNLASALDSLGGEGVHENNAVALAAVGAAEAAAQEAEDAEELDNPESNVVPPVVSHGVESALASELDGPGAESHGVLVEDEGGRGDEDGAVGHAGEEVAVDGHDAEVLHPDAKEHEEGVQADQTQNGAVQDGNN